jgi:glycerol-3-phosphate dehydrogenase (NAD(P)+)
MKITILGAGATALAIPLARKHQVVLWGRNAQAMQAASEQRENSLYLPAAAARLAVSSDFDAAVRTSATPADSLLIAASSVSGLRELAGHLRLCHSQPGLAVQGPGRRHAPAAAPGGAGSAGIRVAAGVLSGPPLPRKWRAACPAR